MASFTSAEDAINDGVIIGVFKALVSKLANTRINEFMNAKVARVLEESENVGYADETLRLKLKSYSLAANRK